MVNILVCEDEKIQREKIEKVIYNKIDTLKLDMDIVVSSGECEKVIEYSSTNKFNNNLYFMDVELENGVNGIEKSSEIRKVDKEGMIVFVTSHAEMSLLTFEYKVQAADYIVKNSPSFDQRIEDCLINADKKFNKIQDDSNEYISIENCGVIQKIKIEDILFIETANDHRIRIHTLEGIVELYGTIKEYTEMLPEYFVKSHRSYFVNTRKIEKVNKSEKIIDMVNGEQCMVSRMLVKDVLKWLK